MTSQPPPDPRVRYFEDQFDAIDLEFVRQAALCGLALRKREEMRSDLVRVLENDTSVCPKASPQAFQKLRAILTMHMTVRDQAIERLGREQALVIVDEVAHRLAKRLGIDLGEQA
jgi:hypothetical protein